MFGKIQKKLDVQLEFLMNLDQYTKKKKNVFLPTRKKFLNGFKVPLGWACSYDTMKQSANPLCKTTTTKKDKTGHIILHDFIFHGEGRYNIETDKALLPI